MTLPDYFVADDAEDVPTIWHTTSPDDPAPHPVLTMFDLRHDPRLWDALVAALDADAEEHAPTQLMTEPHDGHEAGATCPGCPHPPTQWAQA